MAEFIWTKGFFTDEGIGFQSIWEGMRYYDWPELAYVVLDKIMVWYVFDFGDGRKIRISMFLCGNMDFQETGVNGVYTE